MIVSIFPNNFYSLISAPNKEEIFKEFENPKVDRKKSEGVRWNQYCNVKVDALYPDQVAKFLKPTLDIFLAQFNFSVEVNIDQIWRNTYERGGYQEIHDHSEHGDLSGCLFLGDIRSSDGKFYFYNRHGSEVKTVWKKLLNSSTFGAIDMMNYCVAPKAGDVLLFPSYMLHGVTPHNSKKPRRTVSFNIYLEQ